VVAPARLKLEVNDLSLVVGETLRDQRLRIVERVERGGLESVVRDRDANDSILVRRVRLRPECVGASDGDVLLPADGGSRCGPFLGRTGRAGRDRHYQEQPGDTRDRTPEGMRGSLFSLPLGYAAGHGSNEDQSTV